MNKKVMIGSIALIFLIIGCTETKTQETVLTKAQGVAVTSFRPAVNRIGMGGYDYVLLVLRNNAEGVQAENIYVSLENVEPFKIQECGVLHNPSDVRVAVCESFYNDLDQPYKTHYIEQMFPDEEIQFFWNIKAPEKEELANMYFKHSIYYSILYSYKVSSTDNILAMNQQEYFDKTEEGATITPGGATTSAGEISITPKTQQPIIYTTSEEPTEFLFSIEIANTGEGVPNPNTPIRVVVDYPESDYLSTSNERYSGYGWRAYNDNTDKKYFEGITISENALIKEIQPDVLYEPFTINLPFSISGGNIYEPEKTLTFNIHISYGYMKEGLTEIESYPIK